MKHDQQLPSAPLPPIHIFPKRKRSQMSTVSGASTVPTATSVVDDHLAMRAEAAAIAARRLRAEHRHSAPGSSAPIPAAAAAATSASPQRGEVDTCDCCCCRCERHVRGGCGGAHATDRAKDSLRPVPSTVGSGANVTAVMGLRRATMAVRNAILLNDALEVVVRRHRAALDEASRALAIAADATALSLSHPAGSSGAQRVRHAEQAADGRVGDATDLFTTTQLNRRPASQPPQSLRPSDVPPATGATPRRSNPSPPSRPPRRTIAATVHTNEYVSLRDVPSRYWRRISPPPMRSDGLYRSDAQQLIPGFRRLSHQEPPRSFFEGRRSSRK
jgi:hypothetical protein